METILFIQSLYYLLTGAWSLVHIASFIAVTGPKTDIWLVRTVGVLVIAIGAALLAAALGEVTLPIMLLSVLSAVSLIAIEVHYVRKKVISPVYLLDTLVEAAILLGWLLVSGT